MLPARRGTGNGFGPGAAPIALIALILLSFAGCSGDRPSVLDARGPAAQGVLDLWWVLLAASAVAFAVVCALIVAALARARRAADPRREPPLGERFIVIAGVVVTGLVLIGVFALSVRQMRALAESGAHDELAIDVIAHDWWWEAKYPNGAVTANEMHIPVGRPIRLRLSTADVIHSFWVPQLGPKMDMIPGRTNELVIEADEPGRFRGQCAEFCGLQHANMIFWVEALADGDFEQWVARQGEPARDAVDGLAARGRRVFERSSCAGCHAIRGTSADGAIGPDLTHLASRRTIGSGVLPMNERDLTRWIADPQEFKPGTTMPRTEVRGRDFQALIAYLLELD